MNSGSFGYFASTDREQRTNLLGERFGDQIFVIVFALLVVHFVYARPLRVHAIKGTGAACARLIS